MADEEKTDASEQEQRLRESRETEEQITEAADSASTSILGGVGDELREQTYSEDHPLGPFKAPESVEVAGIRENVGYVPRWLVYFFIFAIVLSLLSWIRVGGPLS